MSEKTVTFPKARILEILRKIEEARQILRGEK